MKENWINLPCEGAKLQSCTFGGNGKDAEVIIQTVGNPKAIVPTHNLETKKLEGLEMDLKSVDDANIEMRLSPLPGKEVVLSEAKIMWWGEPDEWQESFAEWGQGTRWELPYVCPISLSFECRSNGQ
jgi:hypothetical protein